MMELDMPFPHIIGCPKCDALRLHPCCGNPIDDGHTEECEGRTKTTMLEMKTIEALRVEVEFARAKFPRNRRLTIALTEELGELAKAELQGRPRKEIQREALQVACVALRIYEETDADFDTLTVDERKP